MYVVLLNYTQPLEVIEKHLAAHRSFLDAIPAPAACFWPMESEGKRWKP